MTKPPKRPRDPNQLAKLMADIATGDEVHSQFADDRGDLLVDNLGERSFADASLPENYGMAAALVDCLQHVVDLIERGGMSRPESDNPFRYFHASPEEIRLVVKCIFGA